MMSNRTAKAVSTSVEEVGTAGEAPAKVVQMEVEPRTVSQMVQVAGKFTRACKSLETLYSMRERFNEMFFGTGDTQAKEIEYLVLVPFGSSVHRESETFRVSNPDTLLKIRALVAVDLGNRIEELETQIVNFKL